MDRIEAAFSIPLVVFPAAAIFAIAAAWILHQVPRFYAPGAALVMVVIVTAWGFMASARAGDD